MPESIPKDPAKAAALARDPGTPVETLAKLAKSEPTFLREDVARHQNVTPELLQSLMPGRLEKEVDHRIAAALVSNPICPSSVLGALIRLLESEMVDGSRRENRRWEDLAVALLSHANCPETDAAAFLRSADLPRAIKVPIAERSPVKGVLRALLADPSETVRRAAAARTARTVSS
jgi:hypothetical protein